MDMNEIKEQIEIFTQRHDNALSPEAKQMYANMLNVWKNTAEKLKNKPKKIPSIDVREARLKRNVEKLGIKFSAWEEWAHNLYEITGQGKEYTVKSHARDWLEPVEWQVDSDLGALEKVYQLVAYKVKDRKSGHGDVLRDLGLLKDQPNQAN